MRGQLRACVLALTTTVALLPVHAVSAAENLDATKAKAHVYPAAKWRFPAFESFKRVGYTTTPYDQSDCVTTFLNNLPTARLELSATPVRNVPFGSALQYAIVLDRKTVDRKWKDMDTEVTQNGRGCSAANQIHRSNGSGYAQSSTSTEKLGTIRAAGATIGVARTVNVREDNPGEYFGTRYFAYAKKGAKITTLILDVLGQETTAKDDRAWTKLVRNAVAAL